MSQENENILKPETEDFSPINKDYECDSQNASTYVNTKRYIDADPYSYISDLIIQFSKIITNGRGLSQTGVNSLFLFILTSSLIYTNSVFPQTFIEFVKLYSVPLFFFCYLMTDLLKNINWINNLFMRIFKGSDFAYYTILNDSVNLNDLENYLGYKVFSSEQLIIIVKHLIKKGQLTPKSQVELMYNPSLYEVKSINYIKDLLLEFEFTPQAVNIFLWKMERRLDHKYLNKIIEKYGEFPSVQFSVGKYHKYKINEQDSYYKLGYDFIYRPIPYYDILIILLTCSFVSAIVLIIVVAFNILDAVSRRELMIIPIELKIWFLVIVIVMFLSSLLNKLDKIQLSKSLRKYLQNRKDLDENISREIITNFSDSEM